MKHFCNVEQCRARCFLIHSEQCRARCFVIRSEQCRARCFVIRSEQCRARCFVIRSEQCRARCFVIRSEQCRARCFVIRSEQCRARCFVIRSEQCRARCFVIRSEQCRRPHSWLNIAERAERPAPYVSSADLVSMLKAQWRCLLRAARRVFNHTALRTPGAMAFCSIGCLLVLVAHYGLAEPVVDAVPTLHTAEPGGNITLKCGVDTSKINAYLYAVTWYRQEPDGRIQIVTSLSTGYLKEGRYSGGIDNKNGQYNLTIAGLHRNDSAVYFCIARTAALQFVPGSSTKLVVSDPLTVPSVELYSPGLFEDDSDWSEPAPVLCLVRDTSPGRHRVLWTIDAEAAETGSAEEGEIEPDGSYTVRSYVTISADQWNSSAVKCEVYNNFTNVTEKVSTSHRSQGELRS
ncbi:UNVERIFIED_CONTAM: hypothetical protein FKN15_043221 [Acipenser sinensis]